MRTFIAYFSGFTIEFFVVMIFVFQFLHRATFVLASEKGSALRAKAQEYRYELLRAETSDVIFEYFIKDRSYEANRSIYAGNENKNITYSGEEFENLIRIHPEIGLLRSRIEEQYSKNEVDSFEIDLSYTTDSQRVPLWFSCESFVVHDNDEPVSVIGKLRDITDVKAAQERLREQRLSQVYSDSHEKNSIYKLHQKELYDLEEEDFDFLTKGRQFLTKVFDDLKYSSDYSRTIKEALESIGRFFSIDRICVLESDEDSGVNLMSYQWANKKEDLYDTTLPDSDKNERFLSNKLYDSFGYLEINPRNDIMTSEDYQEGPIVKYIFEKFLGNQIWIPTLSDGKYNGAIFFDKYDAKPYTVVEKLLFSDVVNTISAYVNKVNAEASNKAKSRFLSAMSHEIRTPMNAIVGMTEVALRDDEMSGSVRKCLKTVQSSAFGLLSLINDILDFSKIEAGKIDIIPEEFHIFSLINDVYELVKARNDGKLNIELEIDDNIPSVLYGDVVRIKQVMINFSTNAIKYTDEGYVKLKVRALKDQDDKCLLSFVVEDSGIGIRKEDLGKLFKSYGQVDAKANHHKEGTGLGLAISKQLVDLMDGSVTVESEYGKGSTFSFYIPLKVIDETPAGKFEEFDFDSSEKGSDDEEFTAPGVRVLIVDDTNVNLVVAKALFKPLGFLIDEADSGESALQMVKENRYDLILMDYFMPGMDGIETSKAIRNMEGNANRDIPIIALTADANSGVKDQLIKEGINDYITKPIVVKTAYSILKKWIPRDKIVSKEM